MIGWLLHTYGSGISGWWKYSGMLVSCEFDKFGVDNHLCKLRTMYIARHYL